MIMIRDRKVRLLSVLLCVILLLAGAIPYSGICDAQAAGGHDLAIHMIDLKNSAIKGDAVLLESGGQYLLIDTGDKDDSDTLITYLKNRGVRELDVYISHLHSDHFGELNDINDNFTIGTIYAPERSIMEEALEDV